MRKKRQHEDQPRREPRDFYYDRLKHPNARQWRDAIRQNNAFDARVKAVEQRDDALDLDDDFIAALLSDPNEPA